MEKLTVAQINKDLRVKAMEAIANAVAINADKSKYGIDIMGIDGEPHFVRIDIVVPKDDLLLEDYLQEMEIKEQEKMEAKAKKDKEKADKIARDEARRAKSSKEAKAE